jgi:hypothetical protein
MEAIAARTPPAALSGMEVRDDRNRSIKPASDRIPTAGRSTRASAFTFAEDDLPVPLEDYVPSPGFHCAACEYFEQCRLW